VRREVEELMKLLRFRFVVPLLIVTAPVFAQDARSVELPNAMSIHTWFIIGAVGAFLVWCISYAIQLQKEALERKDDHADLRKSRDELLNRLAELETQKEAGQISEQRYNHEYREVKFRLARVLEQIATPEGQKSAKKTS
jgi:ribosomal protein L29